MSAVVLCQYFIQNESGKLKGKKQIMNAFVLTKKVNSLKEVRVLDIKASFPLDHTQYHFRFQTKMFNMKVWVDTSKDTVAVPNIDGFVKIKLIKLPKGVADKKLHGPPSLPIHVEQPVFEKKQSKEAPSPNKNYLSPTKGKPIHHSNSQNNISDTSANINKYQNHKPLSQQQDDDEDLIADNNHIPAQNNHDEMDFNIDTDEIFNDHPVPRKDEARQHDSANLLDDFETLNMNNASQPANQPQEDFNLVTGLDDLDFGAGPKEEVKGTSQPQNIIQHVKDINDAEVKQQEDWQLAIKKHDHRIRNWKGIHQMNSIKILL
jgi:hypothetical protein